MNCPRLRASCVPVFLDEVRYIWLARYRFLEDVYYSNWRISHWPICWQRKGVLPIVHVH